MSWVKFCANYKIPTFKSSGRNVSIHCPFCSRDDSPKLGLHLDSSAYRCFRDPSHNGYNPAKLIAALLKIDDDEAVEISKQYFRWSASHNPTIEKQIGSVKKPEEFREFTFDKAHEKGFLRYLQRRGYDPAYVCPRFCLCYSLIGDFAHRIIIPIIERDQWYSWTARTISSTERVRYKTASSEYTKSVPNNHLFDYDNLTGGRLLVVCEGAFDAMKIASSFVTGVQATALFGKAISSHQMQLLHGLQSRYDTIALGLDADAYKDEVKLTAQLEWYMPAVKRVYPEGGKDWGAMETESIRRVLKC